VIEASKSADEFFTLAPKRGKTRLPGNWFNLPAFDILLRQAPGNLDG
jgi:hypothetical protein